MKINIDEFSSFLRHSLKNLKIDEKIIFSTFKKDRSISVIKVSEDSFKIIEDGFNKKEFLSDYKNGLKILKDLKRIEFLRSNILYISRREL